MHIAGTVDYASGAFELFLNGTSIGTGMGTFGSTTYTHGTPTGSDALGADSTLSTHLLDGYMEKPALYSTVLSAAKIQQHYRKGVL